MKIFVITANYNNEFVAAFDNEQAAIDSIKHHWSKPAMERLASGKIVFIQDYDKPFAKIVRSIEEVEVRSESLVGV